SSQTCTLTPAARSVCTAASNSFLATSVNAPEPCSALRWNGLSVAVSGLGQNRAGRIISTELVLCACAALCVIRQLYTTLLALMPHEPPEKLSMCQGCRNTREQFSSWHLYLAGETRAGSPCPSNRRRRFQRHAR